MTDEEIDSIIADAILNVDTVEWERAGSEQEHVESEAERASLERLGAFAKAAREIVQAVATTFADDGYGCCAYCGAEQATLHTADCHVTKARALLGEVSA